MRDDFGSALRARREHLGLSLRSVATEVGISPSMLSQVETGKLHPSVTTLYQIAAFLDVSLDELLGLVTEDSSSVSNELRRGPVQRAEDNPRVELEGGVTWQKLASADTVGFEPLLVTFAPGGSSSPDGRLRQHDGIEFGYLTSGQLILSLEFDRRLIRTGDSFCFRASRPHLFTNESDREAQGVWLTASEQATVLDGKSAAPSGTWEALETIRVLRDSI